MPVIFTRPTKLVGDASENNESFWNEAGNPIVYQWQYGGIVDQVNDNAGDAVLQFNGVDISALFTGGNNAYVNAPPYVGLIPIDSSTFSGGNTLVQIGGGYLGNGSGYAYDYDALQTYSLEVAIHRADNDVQIGVSLTATGITGLVKVDVSGIIKAYLSADINQDLTNSEDYYLDDDGFISTYIIYTETINGVEQSPVDDSANPIYSVFGARQIPSIYGGNLGEYVTWIDGDPVALFLTLFTRPKIFRGYPFLISSIIDIAGNAALDLTYFDADGDSISSGNTDNISEAGLYIFNIPEILSIPDNAKTVVFRLFSGAETITGELTCDIVDTCENPIMLMARNSLGGVMQWVFEGSNEISPDYGGDIKAMRKVLFAENMTQNEWSCLQDFIRLGEIYRDNIIEFTADTIKTTSRIGSQVYIVEPDGSKIGVIVVPTRNRTETKQKRHKFEIEIEYPEEFTP